MAKYLKAIAWFWDGVDVQWLSTNGQPSALLRRGGAIYGMLAITASADGIDQVLWMFNPEKITALSVPGHLGTPNRFADVTRRRASRS